MSIKPLCIDESIDNIVKTYSNMVYRLAFSHTRNKSDADDIFQEVFLRYIKNKPKFETEEHRKAWLIRVTINCAKKLWASSWIKKTQPLTDEIAFETEEDNNLHYELKKLPIKYRTVIHLFYYEDLSIEEISHILKQKPSTVRTQLTRGRRKLKEILKEDYDV
ncbi:sigma-70 family RNA polymerase sigma factor [Tissierella praeacuta]|uniref:RNA polymerase sigma factor n=1 Tax=Tissierella praeacuta TaxID=43131 RepID=UPI00333E95D6